MDKLTNENETIIGPMKRHALYLTNFDDGENLRGRGKRGQKRQRCFEAAGRLGGDKRVSGGRRVVDRA